MSGLLFLNFFTLPDFLLADKKAKHGRASPGDRGRSSIKASQPLHSQARLPLEEFKGESFQVTQSPEFALLAG